MSATGRSDPQKYVRNKHDFFETPAWVTRAILNHLPTFPRVLDPGCGSGAILNEVRKFYDERGIKGEFTGIDVQRIAKLGGQDVQFVCSDYLSSGVTFGAVDLVICNPPYSLAKEFVERSFSHVVPRGGTVAMLLRLNWLASRSRSEWHKAHPSDVYVLPKRPSFTPDGKTDATEYAWFVWGPGRGNRWWILDVNVPKKTGAKS